MNEWMNEWRILQGVSKNCDGYFVFEMLCEDWMEEKFTRKIDAG